MSSDAKDALLCIGVAFALAAGLALAFAGDGCELKTRPADYHVPPLVIRGTTPDAEDAGK